MKAAIVTQCSVFPHAHLLLAWSKGLWGHISRARTAVFAWALAFSCAVSGDHLLLGAMGNACSGGPAGCLLPERPDFNKGSVHPLIHILWDCGGFSARLAHSWHCVPASTGCKTMPCRGNTNLLSISFALKKIWQIFSCPFHVSFCVGVKGPGIYFPLWKEEGRACCWTVVQFSTSSGEPVEPLVIWGITLMILQDFALKSKTFPFCFVFSMLRNTFRNAMVMNLRCPGCFLCSMGSTIIIAERTLDWWGWAEFRWLNWASPLCKTQQ